MPDSYKGWNYYRRLDFEEGKVTKYTIHFYRQEGGWYDEIRYDSHDRTRGKTVVAPHFHLKIQSPFKNDADAAVEEIKRIIDNQIDNINSLVMR